MSDTNTPHDAAIAVITDRVRELDAEITEHQRAIDVATASRGELADLIATLSRKPRARKARAAEPATANVLELAPAAASIFAPVSVEPAEAA
jgi:hypothetical protein